MTPPSPLPHGLRSAPSRASRYVSRRLASWLPAVIWMGAILMFSTDTFSAAHTESVLEAILRRLFSTITPGAIGVVHAFVRKGAHLSVYGVLAWLWFRALRRESLLGVSAAAAAALTVSVAWAIVDETHQATVPSRTSSAWDVVIDGIGATAMLTALRLAGAYAGRSDPGIDASLRSGYRA